MTVNDPNRGSPPPSDSDSPTVAWTRPSSEAHEASPPTAAQPVPRSPGASRARWGIALLVTVLVVAAGVAAVMLLTNRSATTGSAGYAATDSVAYGELRLDLPGDQRQQLGSFLSKFPGFADQSTLDVKIDDVMDRAIGAMTDGRQSWTANIKPWFSGELGFSVGALPQPDDPSDVRALLILTVTDEAKARAWFDEVTANVAKTTAEHQGVQLSVFGEGGKSGAMAIHNGRAMLVGDEASVRAAIDSGGKGTFASGGAFQDAQSRVEGDSLGFIFFDMSRYAAWLEEAAESIPGASRMPAVDLYRDLLPPWMLARIRAQGDALVFDSVTPHVAAATAATENRAGTLAGHVPPSTFVFAEGHDVGASILKGIELLKRDPSMAEGLNTFEEQAALIGGLDGLVGWWGDAAVAISSDGADGIHGGLLIQPTDAEDADRLLGMAKAGIALGAGGSVTVREEDHNGTEITIFDLGDAGSLGGMFGMPAGMPGSPVPAPLEGRVELAVAATDQVVVLGASPSFVRAVLDAGAGDSLADNGRYQELLGKVGAENVGVTFVDLAAIRGLLETLGASEPAAMETYNRDIKPYLAPFDAIISGGRLDGEVDRSMTLITVKSTQ